MKEKWHTVVLVLIGVCCVFNCRGKQLRECGICLETKPLAKGLECAEKHFTCSACLELHTKEFLTKTVAQLAKTEAKVAKHSHRPAFMCIYGVCRFCVSI